MNQLPHFLLSDFEQYGFSIARLSERKKQVIPPHTDAFLFLLVNTGEELNLTVEEKCYGLNSHGILYATPMQIHTYSLPHDAEGFVIYIERILIPNKIMKALELSERSVEINKGNSKQRQQFQDLSLLLNMICRYKKDNSSLELNFCLMRSAVEIIGQIVSYQNAVVSSFCTKSESLVRDFLEKVSLQAKELKKPLKYAEALGVSEAYLSRSVKEQTGFTPTEIIRENLMNEAARYLYYSSSSVTEIGHHLGFEDIAYFRRLFRKHYKITPGEYRRRLGK